MPLIVDLTTSFSIRSSILGIFVFGPRLLLLILAYMDAYAFFFFLPSVSGERMMVGITFIWKLFLKNQIRSQMFVYFWKIRKRAACLFRFSLFEDFEFSGSRCD